VATELEAAAEVALARGATGTAAELLQRSADRADVSQRSRLLIAAARAMVGAGDSNGAASVLRGLLEAVTSKRAKAEVLLLLAEITYASRPQDALPLLFEALDVAVGDPRLQATVHCQIAAMADNDPAAAHRSAMAAVEILERSDAHRDTDLLASALLERAYCWLREGERVATEDIERAIDLLTPTLESQLARRAREVAIRCLYQVGRLRDAWAMSEVEYHRIANRGELGLLPPIVQDISLLEQMLGDWQAARLHAVECQELVDAGEEVWRGRALMAQGRVLAYEGDLDHARLLALDGLARQEEAADRWEALIFLALLGFIELSVPDPWAALRHLERAARYADEMDVRLPTFGRFAGDLVEAAVLTGDLDRAELELRVRLEQPLARVKLPWIEAMALRSRGFVEAARGHTDEAVQSFDKSLEVFATSLPMPFERGRTLVARGQTHLRVGHRRLARDDIDQAAEIFAGLGAQAWSGRCESERRRIGGRAASRWQLTESERSVATLAAAGHSNREIADRLVISIRTVESHLAAAYRKLDIRSRSQLAMAMRSASFSDSTDVRDLPAP